MRINFNFHFVENIQMNQRINFWTNKEESGIFPATPSFLSKNHHIQWLDALGRGIKPLLHIRTVVGDAHFVIKGDYKSGGRLSLSLYLHWTWSNRENRLPVISHRMMATCSFLICCWSWTETDSTSMNCMDGKPTPSHSPAPPPPGPLIGGTLHSLSSTVIVVVKEH